jgi:DNA-binding NarL/FixJ family response regulator
MRDEAARAIAQDNAAKVASLSSRELEVLVLTAKGFGWNETALLLGIARKTVSNCRAEVYRKLEVGGACEASVIAAKAGVV